LIFARRNIALYFDSKRINPLLQTQFFNPFRSLQADSESLLFFAKFHFTLFREKMQNFREIENAKLLHTAKNSENFAKKKNAKIS